MKAVILAGGFGTRLSEETDVRPKPMIEIGDRPLIWHVMKIYAAHGISEFIICLGYKGHVLKEYFANYLAHVSDIRVDLGSQSVEYLNSRSEDWRITLVDTGEDTMTGGRLKRVGHLLGDEPFLLTYGDGVANVDITASIQHHADTKRLATVTAVRPPGRFGILDVDADGALLGFNEKSESQTDWINGGFFVLQPDVLDYIEGDGTSWELEPLSDIARDGQLSAFFHTGFWQPCDTLRDKRSLEELWQSGSAPWRVWEH